MARARWGPSDTPVPSAGLHTCRFRTNTNAECLIHGNCAANTFTTETSCAVNPPTGYKGPQCLLEYCDTDFDKLCTRCKYD
jgi:hypothetical protein